MLKLRLRKKPKMQPQFAEKASKEKYDAVIVFGGDGTVNEVISGIAEKITFQNLGLFLVELVI